LIDISVEVQDDKILKKYGLQLGKKTLASPQALPLLKEVWQMKDRRVNVGGASINTARAANCLLKHRGTEGKVTYVGAIGIDQKAQFLEREVLNEGIDGNFYKHADIPTGTCAEIILHNGRSMCTDLGATCQLNMDYIHQNKHCLDGAKIIYTTGFMVSSNFESIMTVAKYATDNDIPFGLNFGAVFLLDQNTESLLQVLEHSTYVFGNENEWKAFAKTQGMPIESTWMDIGKAIVQYKKVGKG